MPHHLIDVLDPAADFSAGDFYVLARAAAEDILRVGRAAGVIKPLFWLQGVVRRKGLLPAAWSWAGCAGVAVPCCQGLGGKGGGSGGGMAARECPCPLTPTLRPSIPPHPHPTARQDAHSGRRHRLLPALVCARQARHARGLGRQRGRCGGAPGAGVAAGVGGANVHGV